MPKLFDLFLKLSNIPSTSTGVERFFSISGLVCDKRRLTMREDLIEYRSMIKANMYTLDNICLNKSINSFKQIKNKKFIKTL